MIRLRALVRPLRNTTRQAGAGFLLAEMIVTMAISAFLLVALLSAVSLMVRSVERTSRAGEELETTSRVLSSLFRDLSLVSRVTFAGEDAGFVFLGTGERLIYAYDRVEDGRGETRVVDLAVVASPRGFGLERREALFVPSTPGIENLAFGAPEIVHAGPSGLRFAYLDALPDGTETLADAWTQPARLPVAIRVTLGERPSGASELALRVPLLITAEPGCAAPDAAICLSGDPEADGEPDEDAAETDDPLGWRRYVQ